MFEQLVSKQANYATSYGTSIGNTVLPCSIAVSPYLIWFYANMHVNAGFPLYYRSLLPCNNVARTNYKPY